FDSAQRRKGGRSNASASHDMVRSSTAATVSNTARRCGRVSVPPRRAGGRIQPLPQASTRIDLLPPRNPTIRMRGPAWGCEKKGGPRHRVPGRRQGARRKEPSTKQPELEGPLGLEHDAGKAALADLDDRAALRGPV